MGETTRRLARRNSVYESSHVLSLLRCLRDHGPRSVFNGHLLLPSAGAMRKLNEFGLIDCKRMYVERTPSRDGLLLELSITEKGREWIDAVDLRRSGALRAAGGKL